MEQNFSDIDKQKIIETLEKIQQQYSGTTQHRDLANLVSADSAKLIECRHEIVISLVANIYEEDDTGQTVASKGIYKNNYHIPVPAHQDYNEYLQSFFTFFEKCMSTSADNATTNPDENKGKKE